MARLNLPVEYEQKLTHEGAPAVRIGAELELKRSVMACMLWEDSFYESGVSIAERIQALIPKVTPEKVAAIARAARAEGKLRHVPLLLARELARGSKEARLVVSDLLFDIIQRPDELAEFLAIYWKDKKQPLSAQVKKGLARAFTKFNEYSLAKFNRDGAIKLRDVLFLVHGTPKDAVQAEVWKRLVEKQLAIPDTWEVALSGGADKKETFERLLAEKKLGALALLRNLRNMEQAGVSTVRVTEALRDMDAERVLPFRFISAAKYAPKLEDALESAMFRCLSGADKLSGKTVLIVDNSGSMYGTPVSRKSEIDRSDAACALAILLREICEQVVVISYSTNAAVVPARRGFALRDCIKQATEHSSTNTEYAKQMAEREGYDRLILITDEQSHQALSQPTGKAYCINVANERNGIGYGQWTHIDGWSEAIVDFIREVEKN